VVEQTPLLMIHSNKFTPTLNPVTPDAGLPGKRTDALPASTVHEPVPTEGVFPARVAVVEQTVRSVPAFAAVGSSSLVIVTVSLDGGHEAFVMVQTNAFAPIDRPVTPDVGLPGVVTEALPAITVQEPVPTVGVFAANVDVVEQTS
jgi:hypothetical protein